jgi:hypothetical protein
MQILLRNWWWFCFREASTKLNTEATQRSQHLRQVYLLNWNCLI